jgi:hypothetical protein
MTFTQRLWRYMMGLFMGTLLALFFFGSRSCSQWLPNEQVRLFLGEPGLVGDERTRCLMRCGVLTMADLRSLLEDGRIRYGQSDVRNEEGTGKFYHIEGDETSAEYVRTDSTTTVRNVDLAAASAQCECD